MTKQVSRYLITTADEQTWKFDRPVVFLGEWCRSYDRKHVWQSMDAIVAKPYGLGQLEKDADHLEARQLGKLIFPLLCQVLNKYHGVNYGKRYWQILLGHWLQRYMNVILNRVKTLDKLLQNHVISGTTVYENMNYVFATRNSRQAIWAFDDDRWNNALTMKIIHLLDELRFPVEIIAGFESEGFQCKEQPSKFISKSHIKKWFYRQYAKVASYLVKDSDALIINSYLPKMLEIELNIAFKQFPQFWIESDCSISVGTEPALRRRLSDQVVLNLGNNVSRIASLMLFDLLPICFLEGFKSINKIVKQQPWPQKPKFIFTSNNFDTDEIFKFYTASKVEIGCPYFVGQHGSHGVSRNHNDPSNEEITADKFITWGWIDGLPQHIPAFVFKTACRKTRHYNPQGGLLLIELHSPQRLNTWDETAEFSNYYAEQQIFARALTSKAKQHLTIRLHGAYKYLKWNEQARWQAFDPSLKIDTGNVAIQKLIARSRIVVHSYDSTGIIETLNQNIPTLAFWQNGLDHLRDSAKPYYQSLVDIGIIHFSAQSAADKVNEIWDNAECWWAGSEIQEARKKFCDRYSKSSQNPISDLKLIFTENC